MSLQVTETNKWHRGGFLSSLNRSFRMASGKSRSPCSSPLENKAFMEMTPTIVEGLNSNTETSTALRPLEIVAPRIDTYRFSMANLEETQDADLDAILGELCALDSEYDEEISRASTASKERGDAKTNSQEYQGKPCSNGSSSIARTDSPDNDSAFSDTVSMLSSESSASSSASSKCKAIKLNLQHQNQNDPTFQLKADKIKLALERMREANIKKLFIKAFSMDGSSKSLLVDEKMTCGYVTRLLADKNHVSMEPKWAIVEHLPDLYMERVYEDHEMLVDNLMLWTRESKNKLFFAERQDKISLFQMPEKYLLSEDDRGWTSEQDEHSRQVIIEDFFGQSGGTTSTVPSISGHPVPPMEGPLYMKSDAKKGWKKYHFVLRPSGLYYSPKDKVKTIKELVCLATFDTNEVYIGLNWKKKYKSPTDYCFAIKHPRLQQPKSVKFIKFLCADDQQTLERWITAMRIAKHGRQLLENHRSLVEELTQEDLDHLAHARSCSITSIPTKANGTSAVAISSPVQSASSNASVVNSDISSGRHSRASSSSSSGCLSDGGTASESAFDCEFPMGTIKRKPSMKPNIPLTWMTRQLKEMAEGEAEPGDGGTLTRRPRHSRDDSTLKRHHDTSENRVYGTLAGSPARLSGTSDSNGYCTPGLFTYELDELPPPPPPCEEIFSSTLSLDSLPPPPPPADLGQLTTEDNHTVYSACLLEMQKKVSTLKSDSKERSNSIKKVNFADDVEKKKKGFEASPRAPPPPRRSEHTRLSSPRKLADSTSNPPKEFLNDLQRVMRKKWQVAQKCKLEPATTPHEVLGFREYPLSDTYKEASVSMWVQEHYGGGDPFYENVFGREVPMPMPPVATIKKRPPPAPPRRSDSTHLTHAHPSALPSA